MYEAYFYPDRNRGQLSKEYLDRIAKILSLL